MNANYDAQTPYSEESERAVLGRVLMDGSMYSTVASILRADDFFYIRHKVIWQAMTNLNKSETPIDSLTLFTALQGMGKLDEIGGASYLLQLATDASDLVHTEVYARLVAKVATRRRLLEVSDNLRNMALDDSVPVDDTLLKADTMLTGLINERTESTTASVDRLASMAMDKAARAAAARRNGDQVLTVGIPTGLTDFDRLTHGIQAGRYLIFAGRPGTGKSVIALQIALAVAQHEYRQAKLTGKPAKRVLIFPTELTEQEVTDRMITQLSGIAFYRHQIGAMNPQEWNRYTEAVAELSDLPIDIDTEETVRPAQIRAKVAKHQQLYGVAAVIVDGTYMLEADERVNSIYEKGDNIAKAMKRIARYLNVPVITTHQLGRNSENRAPVMSDLNDSKGYEQNADLIVGMWSDPDMPGNNLQAHVIKHRNGAAGCVTLYFDKEQMKLYDATVTTVDLTE